MMIERGKITVAAAAAFYNRQDVQDLSAGGDHITTNGGKEIIATVSGFMKGMKRGMTVTVSRPHFLVVMVVPSSSSNERRGQ
jgi:hypothetical protein